MQGGYFSENSREILTQHLRLFQAVFDGVRDPSAVHLKSIYPIPGLRLRFYWAAAVPIFDLEDPDSGRIQSRTYFRKSGLPRFVLSGYSRDVRMVARLRSAALAGTPRLRRGRPRVGVGLLRSQSST